MNRTLSNLEAHLGRCGGDVHRVKEKQRNFIYCVSTLSKEKERIAFKN